MLQLPNSCRRWNINERDHNPGAVGGVLRYVQTYVGSGHFLGSKF